MSELRYQSLEGCVPAKRSSHQGPEIVLVKLEDCPQPLVLNVIVKKEEEEKEIWERENKEIKENVEEGSVKEEVEDIALGEKQQENMEEEEAVDGIIDPGDISNPGSDNETNSTALRNYTAISRQKQHHCMDCFTSFYESQDHRLLKRPAHPTNQTSQGDPGVNIRGKKSEINIIM
ncbi:hypothetical protein DPEC_G00169510 [Dallia pectoralis]|uniref:Uncharacterized protein n=1 Tax=Dallia pectoralis TaxID=75939 RepID=A0ACC2GCJ8_DALPE|nr:hypothetical protein DPEC_G00169510 [Dallia pectoralis]